MLLATWNIRDFDSNKFGYGPREPETFFYLAEIISSFDLVAVQEVNRDLRPLQRLIRILGTKWDFIATDTTSGPSGNDERMAFLYNTDKVWFRKVAGEIVLPKGQTIVGPRAATKAALKIADETAAKTANQKRASDGLQFARTPFLVAFQSGWFRFSLCIVHIYYGAASGSALERRIDEIRALVKFFADRQDQESQRETDAVGIPENYILLGDFNVVSPDHKTLAALTDHGFVIPDAIKGERVHRPGDHYYDQIATRVKDLRFKVIDGGLYDIYAQVFRDNEEDLKTYGAHIPAEDPETHAPVKDRRTYYLKWRTWQMSDHKPLWVAIGTDFADDYLGHLVNIQA